MKKQHYIFHADCHGVQNLMLYDKITTAGLNCHCKANFQRFAIWGLIELDDELFKSCQELIKTDDGKKILLKSIKERQYSLPVGQSDFKRFMERIPNDELDPFY